jgi:hypothetical protein
MKKNYIFKFLLLLIPITAFTLMSNAGGKQSGSSGSPGDGNQTCANCHNGGNFNASTVITSNIPLSGYELNTDYTINVNTTSSSTTHGFQMAAENSSNTKIGTFIAGTGVRLAGSNITHSSPSSSGDWSFTWKSPATDLGAVTFYTAVNAANGSGTAFDNADQTVTAKSSSISLSISEAQRLDFETYPNPASDKLNIQLSDGENEATVQFYDYVGRLALSKKITKSNQQVDVNVLTSGVYVLKIVSHGKIGSQKFIKK